MKKTAIIYKSLYGAAKFYAEKLSERIDAEIFSLGESSPNFSSFDTVIFVLPIYAGSITASKAAAKIIWKLANKKIIVATVGLTDDENDLKKAQDKGFPGISGIIFSHLPGVVHFDRLGFVHRSMLAMMNAVLKRKEKPTKSEKMFIDNFGKTAGALCEGSLDAVCELL